MSKNEAAIGEAITVEESNRRLRLVVEKLRSIPPERFNFASWVGLGWKGDPDLKCGTTACAIGWATTIPELRDLGLRMSYEIAAPIFDGWDGIWAVAVFFGITEEEADTLFARRSNEDRHHHQRNRHTASAAEVADHIERFITSRSE